MTMIFKSSAEAATSTYWSSSFKKIRKKVFHDRRKFKWRRNEKFRGRRTFVGDSNKELRIGKIKFVEFSSFNGDNDTGNKASIILNELIAAFFN